MLKERRTQSKSFLAIFFQAKIAELKTVSLTLSSWDLDADGIAMITSFSRLQYTGIYIFYDWTTTCRFPLLYMCFVEFWSDSPDIVPLRNILHNFGYLN